MKFTCKIQPYYLQRLCSSVQKHGQTKYNNCTITESYSRCFSSSHTPTTGALESKEQKHVVILGSGITGLSSAHYLLLKKDINYRVTLVDQYAQVAMGTSKKNGELLCPSLSGCWTDMPLFFGEGAILKDYLFQKKIQPIQFHSNTFLDPKLYNFGFHWLRRKYNISKQSKHIQALMEYSMEQFNNDEILSKLDYGRVADGTLTKDGKLANTDSSGDIGLFCSELYKQLKTKHKDRFEFHSCNKVQSLTISPSNKTRIESVKTINSKGGISHIAGDIFVVALGSGSTDICSTVGVQCPIYPVQGYLVTFSSERHVTYNFELNGRAFVAPKGDGIYRLSGMADFVHSSESRKESMTYCTDRVNELLSLAKKEFPDLKVIDTSTCFRPVSPDDTPLIGKASKYNNMFLCTGHGSKGWTMGPGSGKLVSDMITRSNLDIDPNPYFPSRFDII